MSNRVVYLDRRKGPGRRKQDKTRDELTTAVAEINTLIAHKQITGIAFVVFTKSGYKYGVYGTAALIPAQTAGHLLRLSSKVNNDLL